MPLFSRSETLGQKGSWVFLRPTHLLWVHLTPAMLSEAPDQKTYALGEGYDHAEEVPVPGAPPTSEGSAEEVLAEKEDGMKSETGEWG